MPPVEWADSPGETVRFKYQFKRGLASRWMELDPTLSEGEPGYEQDTGMFKIGDGDTKWSELPYFVPGGGEGGDGGASLAAVIAHINDSTPHVVYDEGPSLMLLYENAKV